MSNTIITIFPDIAEKQYFQHPETKEFWFHATGACKALGFDNVSRTLMTYTDEDERFLEIVDGKSTWFVSEAGFYGMAFASKKPKAKEFKRWLKHDVLPKLRASGGYIMPTATSDQLQALQAEIEVLKAEREQAFNEGKQAVAALLPQPDRALNPEIHNAQEK